LPDRTTAHRLGDFGMIDDDRGLAGARICHLGLRAIAADDIPALAGALLALDREVVGDRCSHASLLSWIRVMDSVRRGAAPCSSQARGKDFWATPLSQLSSPSYSIPESYNAGRAYS